MREVDVLIPTCERAAALAVTLTSLAAQTLGDFRVLISDQTEGMDAAAAGEVKAACRVLESHGCPVFIRKHLPRRGIAEQRQFLLDQAEAPCVLCLDDDLILEPYVLDLLIRVLKQEQCGFVGSAFIGLSFCQDIRPEQQHVELWNGPVVPEEVLPDTPAWDRWKLHNAANLYHVQRKLGATPASPRTYKVAWVPGCVLYDSEKLRRVGGFSFWKSLPPNHCGEDVLVQLRLMQRYGGCGVMPSGVYHQELSTTIPDRQVAADRALGWGCAPQQNGA
jgi:GT2 family glycosyltransferase